MSPLVAAAAATAESASPRSSLDNQPADDSGKDDAKDDAKGKARVPSVTFPSSVVERTPSPEVQIYRTGSQRRPSHSIHQHPLQLTNIQQDAGTSRMGDANDALELGDRRSSVGGISFGNPVTPRDEPTDPLLLRSRLVADNDLRRRGGKGKRTDGRINEFYNTQNSHIENLLKPMAKHATDGEEEREGAALKVKIAIYASIIANFVLAALQLYAAISSLSLSLFATAADSVFDPFANLVLNWLHRKSKSVDETKWPIGGARFETIGNIVYAFLMASVSAILIVQSLVDIAGHSGNDKNELHIPSLIAVGIAFVTKFVLFVYCYGIRSHSSQVQVLYEDHRNDLFINGFGIFTSAAGAKFAWWLDPLGAILISIAIIFSWTRTAYLQFRELAGAGAPPEFLSLIVYNAMLHHEHIQQIDSCKAYHSGPKYIVEVDLVMHPQTPLWLSHDISQDLQDRIEDLPMVERAFIHVDHETDHRPEHRKNV
ncbi:unnamed protein product [Tilletia caries]|uniref:Cation efflux protein cytoplasmic domain-containing protein n=1 Tax=Tilletia caries TaxID=13290 RepID=A0ABN7JB18_9BASI|nr:unnamed protein product [Tilletia caries]